MAFVLDEFGELERQCNMGLVDLSHVTDFAQRDQLRRLIEQHAHFTGSARAKRELGQWERAVKRFVAVVPREYKQALERQSEADAAIAAARHGLAIAEARHA
jgi:glutamate synthase (ferredoxin)